MLPDYGSIILRTLGGLILAVATFAQTTGGAVAMSCLALQATGCHGTGKNGAVTTKDAQAFLEDGKFKGKGKWSQSGAPLSLGQKTVVWAGPESASFGFEGQFDFTEPNSTKIPATAAPK